MWRVVHGMSETSPSLGEHHESFARWISLLELWLQLHGCGKWSQVQGVGSIRAFGFGVSVSYTRSLLHQTRFASLYNIDALVFIDAPLGSKSRMPTAASFISKGSALILCMRGNEGNNAVMPLNHLLVPGSVSPTWFGPSQAVTRTIAETESPASFPSLVLMMGDPDWR